VTRERSTFGAAVVILLLSAPALWAQQKDPTGGQVDQSLKRDKDPKETPERPKPKIEVPPREEMKSPDDAKTKIKVERYSIVGNVAISTDQITQALARKTLVVGAEVSLASIKEDANRITALYRDRGFGLAWAYVPAQEVKAGVVEIAVVEGRVDKVLVTGNEHYTAEFIINHVVSKRKEQATDLDALERGLLTLNEYPGLMVRATLRPGDVVGSTDLYLDAEDKFPVNLSMDYDNFGSENTGKNRMAGTVELFDLMELGHWLTLRGVAGLNAADGKLENAYVAYNIPFSMGARISAYGSIYDYEAKGKVSVLEPTGQGETYGLTVSYPVIKNHSMTLAGDIGFEVKDVRQELLNTTTAHDKLRMFLAGGQFEWTDDWWGRWVSNVELRQGLGRMMGGLKNNDPNSSRLNADDSFTRLNGSIYRLQKVLDWVHVIGKVSGQYSHDPLVVSEQFSLGGQDTVRGYPPFEFMADYGYVATAELRVKLPFLSSIDDPFKEGRSVVDMFQIAGFIDTGEGVRNDITFGERQRRNLTGAGVGVRLDYPDRLSVRFDIAWPVTKYDPANGDSREYYISIILNLH
jgi:hemolysin activation/secretion protein